MKAHPTTCLRFVGAIVVAAVFAIVATGSEGQTGSCPIPLSAHYDPSGVGDTFTSDTMIGDDSFTIPASIPSDASFPSGNGQNTEATLSIGGIDCFYLWNSSQGQWTFSACAFHFTSSADHPVPPSVGDTISGAIGTVIALRLRQDPFLPAATGTASALLGLSAIYTSQQCSSYTCDLQHGPSPVPLAAGTICHDQNANICTGTQTCDGAGTCQPGVVSLPTSPDACTAFTCDPTLGIRASVPAGAPPYCSIPPVTFQTPPSVAGQTTNNWVTVQNLLTGTPPRQTLPLSCTNDPALCIDPVRAGILRGRVLQYVRGDPSNKPLVGATVSILDHPEFGSTLTQADGYFDLAVNTGGSYVVDLQMSKFLEVQRTVQTRWQDFAVLDDILMVQPDPATTTLITFGSSGWQRVDGQPRIDADGTRTAHLLIPPGTTATGPNGTATTANVSATEYTAAPPPSAGTIGTGLNGVHAMPGTLPPPSAYTYAMELDATDPTAKQDLGHLTFNHNVFYYVDNFVSGGSIPVGATVPTGSYARSIGAWLTDYSPSQTPQGGQVIEITGFSGGQAVLLQSPPPPNDITPGELQELNAIYSARTSFPISLWRVPLSHFSDPVDMNFGGRLPKDYSWPNGAEPIAGTTDTACTVQNASTIDCENQVLHESVPIVGTPFTLTYSSDRVPGYQNVINVALDGDTVPPNVDQVVVIVQVAGTQIVGFYPPPTKPNQWVQLYWNRKNAYDQLVRGQVTARVNVGYQFLLDYSSTTGSQVLGGYPTGSQSVSGGGARQPALLWQHFEIAIGDYDANAMGLGGWTLSPYHVYQPTSGKLYLGDGTRRSGLNAIISAATTNLGGVDLNGIAAAADGSYYFSIGQGSVFHVSPRPAAGVSSGTAGFGPQILFAGGGTNVWGDNVPATSASFDSTSLATGPDGSVYAGIAFNSGSQQCGIRKIDRSGNIKTVVGFTNGGTTFPVCGAGGDGSPATSKEVFLNYPVGAGFRVLADGAILIADTFNNLVRRVRTDGVIETIAGTGKPWDGVTNEEGIFATQASINNPIDIDASPDGTVYIAEQGACRVRSLTADGKIHTFAGIPTSATGNCGQKLRPDQTDGVPATQTDFDLIARIAVAPDGTVYILDSNEGRLRAVDGSGIIHHVVGGDPVTGGSSCPTSSRGDGGPAGAGNICGGTGNWGLSVLPNGSVLVTDTGSQTVRQIGPAFPGFTSTSNDIDIPSASGQEVYVFDPFGNHKQTLDGLRGVPKYVFTTDPITNQLTSISDHSGSLVQTSTISRSSNQIVIKPPFAGATTLTLDSNGYLSAITNPNGETIKLTHNGVTGLLTSLADAKGQTHTFQYDSQGLLTLDQQPAGANGSITLSHALIGNGNGTGYGWSVKTSSASGYTREYSTQTIQNTPTLPSGGTERQYTSPTGAVTDSQSGVAGTAGETTTTTMPDGSVKVVTMGPAARFGMLAPIVTASSFTTPNGCNSIKQCGTGPSTSQITSMIAVGSYPNLTSLAAATTVNGTDTFTSTFHSSTNSISIASPTGRTVTLILDGNDRVVQTAIPGLAPRAIGYDSFSRVHAVTQTGTGGDGTRQQIIDYDLSTGFVSDVVDSLKGTTKFARDPVGRVTALTMRDGSTTALFSYDLNGNLSTVKTPSGNLHNFPNYNTVDLLQTYNPPDLGQGQQWDTTYSYTPEGLLQNVARPEPSTNLGFSYDYAGRLVKISQPVGNTLISYNDLTTRPAAVQSPDGTSFSVTYYGPLLKSTTWHWKAGGANVAHTVNRNYDGYLRANHYDVDGANAVDLAYDADGLLSSATYSGISPPAELIVKHDPGGNMNGLLASASIVNESDSWTYNSFGEPLSYNATHSGMTPLYTVLYARDGFGRITSKTESIAAMSGLAASSNIFCYTYDPLGRLVQVSIATDATCKMALSTKAYAYDSNGNRTQTNGTSVCAAAPCYDAQDRLASYGATSFGYTNNGDLASVMTGGQTTRYTYDLLGNLKTVPSLPITYLVDGANRRVGKLRNGAFAQGFLYADGLHPLAELNTVGAVLRTFVYGTRQNVPDLMVEPSGNVYRIITDHVGSPRLVVNVNTGNIAERIDYDEFGVVQNDVADTSEDKTYTPIPFGFAGGLYDRDTNLLRFGARDYNPEIGRWTTKDPIGFNDGDANLYVYALNDSVNLIDPSGNQSALALKIASGSAGEAAVGAANIVGLALTDLIIWSEFVHQTGLLIHEWDTDAFLHRGIYSSDLTNCNLENPYRRPGEKPAPSFPTTPSPPTPASTPSPPSFPPPPTRPPGWPPTWPWPPSPLPGHDIPPFGN